MTAALPPVRLAGLLSLTTLAAGIFGEFFVLDSIILSGDAVATANNILASEPLYRLGFAANLTDYVLYVGVTVILYALLKPAGRSLSLLAAVASIIATAIVVGVSLFYLAPLVILQSSSLSATFDEAGQVQALAYLPLRLRAVGASIGMVFFGLHLVFIGVLIVRSTFLPRVLGLLSAIGGLGFLINSFTSFLAPAFAAQMLPYSLAPGVLAQASLALWLLVMGVSAEKWKSQAGAT